MDSTTRTVTVLAAALGTPVAHAAGTPVADGWGAHSLAHFSGCPFNLATPEREVNGGKSVRNHDLVRNGEEVEA